MSRLKLKLVVTGSFTLKMLTQGSVPVGLDTYSCYTSPGKPGTSAEAAPPRESWDVSRIVHSISTLEIRTHEEFRLTIYLN